MTRRLPLGSRWALVGVAALGMGVAGTYQFVWSSVRVAVGAQVTAPETALGTVFTLFIVFQTVSQFPAGWVRDRYGPRPVLLAGAGLLAVGYGLLAVADGLLVVYLAYGVGGVGVGIAYTVTVNTAVKWFDARRGLATGTVVMAYGGLSFFAIPFVRGYVRTDFATTALALGVLSGVVTLLVALVLRDPDPDPNPEPSSPDGTEIHETEGNRDGDPDSRRTDADTDGKGDEDADAMAWQDATRTWQFWLLYGSFVLANGTGLMVIGKVVAYAEALGLSSAVATAGASGVAVADAAGVALVGGASDRFGSERTVAASLVVSGVALGGAVEAGGRGLGVAFVLLVGAAAFFRSPVFAVFPSIVGDYYGQTYSSENYAILNTAKLWGGILGGAVASELVLAIGWSRAFALGAGLLVVAGISLVPLRAPSR